MNPYVIRGVDLTKGAPKLCIPLAGRSPAALRRAAETLAGYPYDLVEWRVDALEDLADTEAALAALRTVLPGAPLLATFRTVSEGGAHPLGEEDYFALLHRLIRTGMIDAVDIEYGRQSDLRDEARNAAQAAGLSVVMSAHDFQKTPSEDEMAVRLEAMGNAQCIAKLAVMPRRAEDVLALLAATLRARRAHPERPIITMSMGRLGVLSRLAGETFGSALTFGAAETASAPGQLDARLLHEILRALHKA